MPPAASSPASPASTWFAVVAAGAVAVDHQRPAGRRRLAPRHGQREADLLGARHLRPALLRSGCRRRRTRRAASPPGTPAASPAPGTRRNARRGPPLAQVAVRASSQDEACPRRRSPAPSPAAPAAACTAARSAAGGVRRLGGEHRRADQPRGADRRLLRQPGPQRRVDPPGRRPRLARGRARPAPPPARCRRRMAAPASSVTARSARPRRCGPAAAAPRSPARSPARTRTGTGCRAPAGRGGGSPGRARARPG